MKPLHFLLVLFFAFAFSQSQSQCTTVLTFNSAGPCSGTTNNGVMLSGNSTCPTVTSIVVIWSSNNGQQGSETFDNSVFQLWIPNTATGNVEICFEVTGLDSANEIVTSESQCFPFVGSSMIITADVVQNSSGCGLNDGCAYLNIEGGVAPYTFYLGTNAPGTTLNGSLPGLVCNLPSGPQYVIVTDATGCTFTQTFNIPSGDPIGLTGILYNDLNGDGIQGTGTFAEPGLNNLPVYIVEADVTVYTNSAGFFYLPELEAGVYTVQFAGDNEAYTSGDPITVTVPGCMSIPIESTTPFYNANAGLSSWSGVLQCQNGLNTGVWIANSGNATLNGTLTMSGGDALTFSAANNGTTFTTNANGIVTWNIVNQAPGTQVGYNVHINGPGTTMIGQSFPMTFTLVLYNNLNEVIYENTWTINPTVTCSYDPNDKAAFPEGYAEPHFILADTEITYRIRFQNTGNAPAEDVYIEDMIDMEHLDLSTFEPVFASHDYVTEVHPNGMVKFVFNNIMLADSVNNEPASHGYLIYRIATKNDVQPGDVIYNSAAIYFDQNEPVITNQTWHTVYDCTVLSVLSGSSTHCEGDLVETSDFTPYVDMISWSLNGTPFSTENEITLTELQTGENNLELTLTNPLCQVTSSTNVIVHPNPEVDLVFSDGQLSTSAVGSYAWTFNFSVIEGANSNQYTPLADGTYSVVVTNEFDCEGSAELLIASVGELLGALPVIFPNPTNENSVVRLPSGMWSTQLLDASGRTISIQNNVQGTIPFGMNNLSEGYYILKLINANGALVQIPLIIGTR